jgi:aspartate 1-decarboxylase
MTLFRSMLRAKIHGATVTHADIHYEGSIAVPLPLIEATDLLPNEEVHVWNVTRGTRFQTYVIAGAPGRDDISVNGAAAHLVELEDTIIIAAFCSIPEEIARQHQPKVIFVDEYNRIKEIRAEQFPPVSR